MWQDGTDQIGGSFGYALPCRTLRYRRIVRRYTQSRVVFLEPFNLHRKHAGHIEQCGAQYES